MDHAFAFTSKNFLPKSQFVFVLVFLLRFSSEFYIILFSIYIFYWASRQILVDSSEMRSRGFLWRSQGAMSWLSTVQGNSCMHNIMHCALDGFPFFHDSLSSFPVLFPGSFSKTKYLHVRPWLRLCFLGGPQPKPFTVVIISSSSPSWYDLVNVCLALKTQSSLDSVVRECGLLIFIF